MGRYERELEVAATAARDAGQRLLEEFHRAGGPRGAHGKCPADTEAEAMLRQRLAEAFPEYGQRGEELPAEDRPASDPEAHVWSIDPNDGTSSFQRGWRGTSVSIGLLRHGQPVLGVVLAYAARAGHGDCITWAEGQPLSRNGSPCALAGRMEPVPNTLLVSTSAESRPEAYARLCDAARFRTLPSIAYRLALVAAGEARGTYTFSGPHDWDVAAGHALLRAADGQLLRMDGNEVTYNRHGVGNVGNCCGGVGQSASELIRRDYADLFHATQLRNADYELAQPDPALLVRDPAVLDRAQGCLLGQLAGDSLGAFVEFQRPERIRQLFPAGVRELQDGGHWQLLAGQPTDDSELALMLARSIIKERRFTPEGAADAYTWWYGSTPFDVGGTVGHALSAAWSAGRCGSPVAAAAAAAAAASKSPSPSNGALMRVSPLAVFGWRRSDSELSLLARQDARLTHAHPVCLDASAVFCVAIAAAIRQGLDGQATYDYASDWAQSSGLHEDVVAALARARTAAPQDFTRHMGWVLIALQNAFYQLLHAATLSDALAATIAAGGDTDTNAAIAGALYGATCGASSVPSRWTDRILTCRPQAVLESCQRPRPRALWPVDCLVVAEQLVALGACTES